MFGFGFGFKQTGPALPSIGDVIPPVLAISRDPTVGGVAQVGGAITGSLGTVTGADSSGFEWRNAADNAVISGLDTLSFTASGILEGLNIELRHFAISGAQTIERVSDPFGPIVAGAPATLQPTVNQAFATMDGETFNLSAAREVGTYCVERPFILRDVNATLASTSTPSGLFSGFFEDPYTGVTYTDEMLQGLMVNPGVGTSGWATITQGYNSWQNNEGPKSATTIQPSDTALNKDPGFTGVPLVATTAQVWVKSIGPVNNMPDDVREGVTTKLVAVHIVDQIPALNSFAPGISSPDQNSYFTSDDMDLSFLLELAPAGTPITYEVALARVKGLYQTGFSNNLYTRGYNPLNANQGSYGRDIAYETSQVLLWLNISGPTAAQKFEVAKYVTQIGLDIINSVLDGRKYGDQSYSHGGGQHWTKPFVLFAARALKFAANTVKAAQLQEYANPALQAYQSDDYVHGYVSELNTFTETSLRATYDHVSYPFYTFGAPHWNSKPSVYNLTGAAWNQVYRLNVLASSIGQFLALRMMGLEDGMIQAQHDYMDMFYNWSLYESWGNDNPRPFALAMCAAYWDSYSPPAMIATAPTITGVFAQERNVWADVDTLLSRGAIPPASAFAITINGVAATVVSAAAVASESLQSPNIYGQKIAVRLVETIPTGATVVFNYTKPATNAARTLGGQEVASFSQTAVNKTGVLPDPATVKDRVYTGDVAATRQYSGAGQPKDQDITALVMSLRFQLNSKTANDTILASETGSTTAFRLYMSTTNDLRMLIQGEQFRMAGAAAAIPLNTPITMHIMQNFTTTVLADRNKAVLVWDGGSFTISPTGSTTSAAQKKIQSIFTLGMYLGANGTSGLNPMHGGFSELLVGWGDTSILKPDFTGPEFAHNADWGGNGENVWGQMQRYYAGSLDEWNSSNPNRASGKPAAMTPRRVDGEGESITPYVLL